MKFSSFKTIGLFLISLVILSACNRNKFDVDVKNIPEPKVQIHDYGTALFSLNRDSLAQGLASIQKDYSLFLGNAPLTDEQVIQLSFYVNDPFLNELYLDYQKKFPSLKPLEQELAKGFQHWLYYYPKAQIPEVYAYISGVQDPVIYQDNVLVIGLDNYLGADCEIYARMGTPRYKILSMTPDFVTRDVFSAISTKEITAPAEDGNVLENMIYEAKKLYFVKSMVPTMNDSILLNFTGNQMAWFKEKESDLWKYYIENELLFKTDYDSMRKLVNEAPFTSVLGNDSPPRTGVWLGYQILLAYAKNTDADLLTILSNNNAQDILKKSKYKPGR